MDDNFGQAYIDECNDWRSRMESNKHDDRIAIIRDLLLLLDMDISIDEIDGWDDYDLDDVEAWAGKSILKANDNNVRVPRKPDVLTRKEAEVSA